tara:strand:- start:17080 stop:17322 length:243 start_codon:yes stop_codon:yes gene_type:complete
MVSIGSEQPPYDVPPALAEYLRRQFIAINIALQSNGHINPIYVLPDKPRDGNIYYFGQIIGATITSIGFWGYENGGYVKL